MYVRTLFTSLLDFLYPPLCLSCSSLLPEGTQLVCAGCLASIARVQRDQPAFQEFRERICEDGVIADVVAPFWFEKRSPLQSIIHALKYQHIPEVGTMFGRALGQEIMRLGLDVAAILPVPLHPAKLREREYNQAEVIAGGVAEICRRPVDTRCIRRRENTRTQTELSAEARRRNVAHAFVAIFPHRDSPKAGPLLIVDDVLTTGATVRSIAEAIGLHSNRRVIAASIALAPRTP